MLLSFSKAQTITNIIPLTQEIREQFIQKATAFRKSENYTAAVIELDSILIANPKDAPILLFKGDILLQNKQFANAVETYKKLILLNYEPTIANINLSYALFMNHQPVNALQFAEKAYLQNDSNTNAIVNYFNAMLWNVKTKPAEIFLIKQQSKLTKAEFLVLKARLFTTSGDFKNGLNYYDSLVNTYPNKYYVQEYAEVLVGKKEFNEGKKVFEKGENYFSLNEKNSFNEKIKAAELNQVGTDFTYFKDVASNVNITNSIWYKQKENKIYRFGVRASFSTITSIANEKTTSNNLQFEVDERWSKTWSGRTEFNLQRIQPSSNPTITAITGKQSIQYQPTDRKMFSIYYSNDILNFTASLLEKNISSNNLGYITHLMFSGKSGFYSQGSYGMLSDHNKRLLFFGSLYHLFRTEPTIKVGFNYSILHFSDSSIKTYFAPNNYKSAEVFMDFISKIPKISQLNFQLQTAIGYQKIEQQPWSVAFRLQTELNYSLKKLEGKFKYQTSNVASAVGTGYKFNSFTLSLIFKW